MTVIPLWPAGSQGEEEWSLASGTTRPDYSPQFAVDLIPAADGFNGFKPRPIESGGSSWPRLSKSTDRVSVDFPEPFGPAITVRVGTLP